MKKLFLLSASLWCFFSIIPLKGQTPTWTWAERGTGDINVNGMCSDNKGNSCYTGYYSNQSAIFGNITLPNTGSQDMFIVKYDANGNMLWAHSAGSSGFDWGEDAVIDSSGNVYVWGTFQSPTITFGSYTLTNADSGGGQSNPFLVKYDANGNVLWATSASGTVGGSGPHTMAIDSHGNVYFGCYFFSSALTFGNITLHNNYSGSMFLVKYTPQGNVVWAQTANSFAQIYGVTIDSKDNVYITGAHNTTMTLGSYTLNNIGNWDAFVARLDTNGNVLWANGFGGSGGNYYNSPEILPQVAAADKNGNIYVTGYFNAAAGYFGHDTFTNGNQGPPYYAYFIAKYDPNGNPQWAQSTGGFNDPGVGIAFDEHNNVFIAGYFAVSVTFGTYTFTNPGNPFQAEEGFIVEYDTSGGVKWAYPIGTRVNQNAPLGIAYANGNVYTAGMYASDTINFGSIVLTNQNPGNNYSFVAKLSVGPVCNLSVNMSNPTLVYYGYAPMASAVISGTAVNGTAPYTYSWSNGATVSSVTVSPISTTTYTLQITDANGCSTSGTVTVDVMDVGCGKNKVSVCHNGHTQCVDANAVPALLAQNGTYLGDCIEGHGPVAGTGSPLSENSLSIAVFPNPNSGQCMVSGLEKDMRIEVYDYTGRKISSLVAIDTQLQINLANQPNGIYLIRVLDNAGHLVDSKKIVVIK